MSAETEVLKTQANIIKNEVDDGKNTANRVGTALLQAATAIDKEKEYCDTKVGQVSQTVTTQLNQQNAAVTTQLSQQNQSVSTQLSNQNTAVANQLSQQNQSVNSTLQGVNAELTSLALKTDRIEKSTTHDMTENVTFCSDDKSETYAKIDKNGVLAKKLYYLKNGNAKDVETELNSKSNIADVEAIRTSISSISKERATSISECVEVLSDDRTEKYAEINKDFIAAKDFKIIGNDNISLTKHQEAIEALQGNGNFTIVWYGTSIPAGGYPQIVGQMLKRTVYNESIGESLVRLGWGSDCIASGDTIDKWGCSGTDTSTFNPISNTLIALAKSLSATKAEKQYLLDNIEHFKTITNYTGTFSYTIEQLNAFSYEEKLLKYINPSHPNYIKADLIVFDHGHNDLNPDGSPKWNTYSISNRNKDNYWGAMNFLMDVIRYYNPHQKVCQISHYQGRKDGESGFVSYSQDFWKAQKQFAEHWGIPFFELWKVTQMSTTEKVKTNGWWGYTDKKWHNEGFVFMKNSNGTYTTNQSIIISADFGISNGTYDATTQLFTSNATTLPATTTNRRIVDENGKTFGYFETREIFMPDRLHPVSDASGHANNTIAEYLAAWIKSTYKL